MAFFNDIGKKLSEAGQSAVQKTKNMTDTVKLNAEISDMEKIINDNYLQIGKLYFALHRESFEPDFSEYIMKIIQAEEKIATFKNTINDIKGIMPCVKCGYENAPLSAFCSNCGQSLETISILNVGTRVCKNCGKEMAENMRFCTSCGTPLENDVDNPSL